jgi:predicted SAM-dependent methyltransferase
VVPNPLSWYRASRRSRQLKALLKGASPVRVVIGACGIFEPGWIPTDVDTLDILKDKAWKRHFGENSIDALLAEHVWEHLTPEEGLGAAELCYRYLKPGGYLRAAVPDGFSPDPQYIEWVRVGGTGAGAADHKVLYDHLTFARLFERAGFEVLLLEYFDSAGVFHAADWDVRTGKIHRSRRFDERNQEGRLRYTSLILDAYKRG